MSVWRKQYPNAPLREPAGAWFVNRKRELNILWEWAISIPTKGSRSITGLRRTGKSSIMAKIYNRLYFEQKKIIPIYISFGEYLHKREPITAQQFAQAFMAGAVRSYLAFTYERSELQDNKLKYSDLEDLAAELTDEVTLEWFRRQKRSFESSPIPSHSVVQWTVDFLGGHASDEHPMLIMIDEFQILTQVLYPEDGRVMDITDSFQYASERWDAPLLVSGSSISMLREEALGGLLSGRFWRTHIRPLEEEHAAEMVMQIGADTNIPVTEELAETIVNITGGYPYSIESIFFSASSDRIRFPDIDAVGKVVEFELTDPGGTLREHYDQEYGKYVTELNGDKLTRKILYWITSQKGPEFDITAPMIARTMGLDTMEVQQSLNVLHRLDIIQRRVAMVYTVPRDPLMRLYLNAFHSLDLEDLEPDDLEQDGVALSQNGHEENIRRLRRKLREQQGEFNRKAGHFTEIIVAGVVRAFDDRVVDGDIYFGIPGDLQLLRCEKILRRHGTVQAGSIHEIDVMGRYRIYGQTEYLDYDDSRRYGVWMVSVRYRSKRTGVADVRQFIRNVEAVQQEKGYGAVMRWFFSKSGFTREAKALLLSEGIYHSDLDQFNRLAKLFDLMLLKV